MAVAVGLYTQDRDETGLTGKQREVLRLLRDEKMTQLAAAKQLGVSRQRIRQHVETLLEKGYDIPSAKRRGA